MASAKYVFDAGSKHVKMFTVEGEKCKRAEKSYPTPPKPLLVASPLEEAEYPVVVFLHGYLFYNSFYSQLFNHIASHGFIVISPQVFFNVFTYYLLNYVHLPTYSNNNNVIDP
jgi:chlorophyllase